MNVARKGYRINSTTIIGHRSACSQVQWHALGAGSNVDLLITLQAYRFRPEYTVIAPKYSLPPTMYKAYIDPRTVHVRVPACVCVCVYMLVRSSEAASLKVVPLRQTKFSGTPG